jgi:hypothetical protein
MFSLPKRNLKNFTINLQFEGINLEQFSFIAYFQRTKICDSYLKKVISFLKNTLSEIVFFQLIYFK